MARGDGGGGGGAFGWTVLGILVGVTATLAVQTLIGGHARAPAVADDVVSASAPAQPIAPPAPHFAAPPLAPGPANVATAEAAPKAAPTPQTDQEVQDDADAVGMTSRSRSADGASQAPPAAQN